LETHHPVDLLSERSAEALAKWLQAHPGVKIISRDRSNEYAKGASNGATDAQQVVDLFNLVKYLREAMELFLEQNRHCLRAAGEVKLQPHPSTIQDTTSAIETKRDSLPPKDYAPTKMDEKR
jgi:transposase